MKVKACWAALGLAVMASAPVSVSAMPTELAATIKFRDFGTQAQPLPDVFEITNNSDAGVTISSLTIDLTGAPNTPVFDTLDGCTPNYCYGAQLGSPVNELAGDDVGFAALTAAEQAALEEAQVLTLSFSGFDAGESFSFTTDLDDNMNFFLTGLEMEGALATVTFSGDSFVNIAASANFESSGFLRAEASVAAVIPLPAAAWLFGSALLGLGVIKRRKT